jgi:hypothetical protein
MFKDFAERIRQDERKRFKQERKSILATVKNPAPVAVDVDAGNRTIEKPADHPDHTPTRVI